MLFSRNVSSTVHNCANWIPFFQMIFGKMVIVNNFVISVMRWERRETNPYHNMNESALRGTFFCFHRPACNFFPINYSILCNINLTKNVPMGSSINWACYETQRNFCTLTERHLQIQIIEIYLFGVVTFEYKSILPFTQNWQHCAILLIF